MSKKLLITGGLGFIGKNLIEYLKQNQPDQYQITLLDNGSSGKKGMIPDHIQFVEGDIRDQSLVGKLLKGMDAIIHLAAETSVINSIQNPDENFDVNVKGTYNLLRTAHVEGIARFVFASTGGAILGEALPPVNETMVPRPLAPYGASKLAGEGYCSAFAGAYGMKTVSLRFSNVYGPHSFHKGSVIATFFKNILKGEPLTVYGDGNQTRDFVFAADLSDAIFRALRINRGGEVYQLGSGHETSINTLIKTIQEVVGIESLTINYKSARQGEISRNYVTIDKAAKDLSYRPKTSLKEGLKIAWDWFCQNKSFFTGQISHKPKASVIVAAYNAERHIEACIASLLAQTMESFEIIIVDDGSTDQTVNKIKRYQSNRIKLIELPENKGVSFARNTGVREASAEYIAILDADDIAMPERLQVQTDYLDSHPEIGLAGSDFNLQNKTEIITIKNPISHQAIQKKMSWRCPIANTTIMVRKAVFLKTGGYPLNYNHGEDYRFFAKLINQGYQVANIPQLLVYKKEDGNGLTFGMSPWKHSVWGFFHRVFAIRMISGNIVQYSQALGASIGILVIRYFKLNRKTWKRLIN